MQLSHDFLDLAILSGASKGGLRARDSGWTRGTWEGVGAAGARLRSMSSDSICVYRLVSYFGDAAEQAARGRLRRSWASAAFLLAVSAEDRLCKSFVALLLASYRAVSIKMTSSTPGTRTLLHNLIKRGWWRCRCHTTYC